MRIFFARQYLLVGFLSDISHGVDVIKELDFCLYCKDFSKVVRRVKGFASRDHRSGD
jgi:hypothetical protein